MLCLCPVLRRLLSPGDGQIVLARPEGVPDKHHMLAGPQASKLFSIQSRIAWDAVTWRARFRITVWKTMNRSEFHLRYRTPSNSEPSILMNQRPTFPLGALWRLDGMTARSRHHTCHSE